MTQINDATSLEGDEPAAPNLLEDKYRQQMRQIHPQKIELPISTLQAMIKDQITLNPDFQRRDRWDSKKQSRFVESVIMNVPIPPVFLGEDEYGSYVVLDGRQRLTAIHEFLKNSYALEGLTVWKELNGMRYTDLEKGGLHKALIRRFVPAILLLKESSAEVKYDVFDRLNTGGVQANEMEIRNAVFRGDFTKLIQKCSALPEFRRLWGIPEDAKSLSENAIYAAMVDVEYVLRFFALRKAEDIEGRFKDYLSLFMKRRNEQYATDPAQAAADESLFLNTVNATLTILGDEAFMRTSTDGKPRRSAPLADAVLFAMSFVNQTALRVGDAELIRAAIENLLTGNVAFRAAVTSGTNGKGSILERTGAARTAVSQAVPHAVIG
jgi:hypothetical protein